MKKFGLTVLFGIMASACASASDPSYPQLYISSAYYSGPVPGGGPGHGVIGFTNTIPTGWFLAIRGEIKPAVGSPGNPVLELFVQATSTSFTEGPVERLDVSLADLDFGPTSAPFLTTVTGTVTAGVATPVYYESWYTTTTPGDEHYCPTTTTTILTRSGPLAGPAYLSSIVGAPITNSQYELSEGFSFSGRGPNQPGATYSLHATLTLIPEPSVASLVACGAIVMFRNRRHAA
jgi:hypothetical protein